MAHGKGDQALKLHSGKAARLEMQANNRTARKHLWLKCAPACCRCISVIAGQPQAFLDVRCPAGCISGQFRGVHMFRGVPGLPGRLDTPGTGRGPAAQCPRSRRPRRHAAADGSRTVGGTAHYKGAPAAFPPAHLACRIVFPTLGQRVRPHLGSMASAEEEGAPQQAPQRLNGTVKWFNATKVGCTKLS